MSRINRLRHEQSQEDLDALADPCNTGQEAMLVVIAGTETTAECGYPCNPVAIRGDEAEGASATLLSDETTQFICFNVGTVIAPSGTKVLAHACGGRWVFRYDG